MATGKTLGGLPHVDARNRLGWTPLMVARGVFVSNTKKDFPEIAAYLEKAEQKKIAGR